MQIKDINGHYHEVDFAEGKRIYLEVRNRIMEKRRETASNPAAPEHNHVSENQKAVEHHQSHRFTVSSGEISLTPAEMEHIANVWWEHYGKSKMEKFFEHYQKKAGEHIAAALGFMAAPESEPEVKAAIKKSLASGNYELAAEVIFEAMEWQTAYSGLKSFER